MRMRQVRLGSQSLKVGLGWLVVALFIILWQLVTFMSDSMFFPTPMEIISKAHQLWFSAGLENGVLTGAFYDSVGSSLRRLLIGLAFAIALGVALGTLLGRIKTVALFVEPILHFMRGLPGPVLIPMALILIGTGDEMRIAIIAFGAVWPVLFNTYSAVRQVPEAYLDTAKVSGKNGIPMLRHVIMPSASSGIFAGVRTATALGVILLVASELVASTNGLGFGLMQSQRNFQFVDMWAYILALSILGYLASLIITAAEKVLLRWYHLYRSVVA